MESKSGYQDLNSIILILGDGLILRSGMASFGLMLTKRSFTRQLIGCQKRIFRSRRNEQIPTQPIPRNRLAHLRAIRYFILGRRYLPVYLTTNGAGRYRHGDMMRKFIASSMLAMGLMAGGAGLTAAHEPMAANGPRASGWRRTKHKGDASKNPNDLSWTSKRNLAARGTHYFKAGVLRCKKRLTSHLPNGYECQQTYFRRGENPIGINGIRGKSGGGR